MAEHQGKHTPEPTDRLIDESEVRRVLERALELDAVRRGQISEGMLIEIASEIGISRDSVATALSEARNKKHDLPPHIRSIGGALKPALIVGGAATVLGILTRAIRPFITGTIHYESIAGTIAVAAAIVVMAWRADRKRPQLTFQSKSFMAWLGFTAGWSLVHGSVWGDLLTVNIPWALGSALVGGIIATFRSRVITSAPPSSHYEPATGFEKPLIVRLWNRAVETLKAKFVAEKVLISKIVRSST